MKPFIVMFREYWTIRERLAVLCCRHDSIPHPGEDPEIDSLQRNKKQLELHILGHPMSFDSVRCWMVDINGTSRLAIDDQQAFEHAFAGFQEGKIEAVDLAGKLAHCVRVFIQESGFGDLSDVSFGTESWNLGVHCTEREARDLCEAVYRKYRELIERGVLKVQRSAWSLALKDMSLLGG